MNNKDLVSKYENSEALITGIDKLTEMMAFKNRELYLNDVTREVADAFNTYIRIWNKLDVESRLPVDEREPIKIYINSNGGYVQDMWSLVDIMINSKTPIYTYSTGYAHSCGFLIFIAGTKRFITKHTKMCCHQFSGGATGMYQDIKEKVEDLDRMWRDFEDYICTQTKITKARLQEIREKKLDWYIYSEESIGLGVATDFVDKF